MNRLTVQRYERYLDELKTIHSFQNERIWKIYQNMIVAVAPINESNHIPVSDAKKLLRAFPSAKMCRTTGPAERNQPDLFYAVICKTFSPISDLSSKRRSEIKKGLEHCAVRKVAAAEIVSSAWAIYNKALHEYGIRSSISLPQFEHEFAICEKYSDIIHFWGIFNNNKLVGYAKIQIFDKTEANITVVKFDPEFMNLFPAYALFHTLNEYYLQKEGFQYINDGFCSLLHETNVQGFLIQKFGYEKFPVDIQLHYSFSTSLFLAISIPFRFILRQIHPKFKALFRLVDIANAQKKVKKPL